MRPTQRTVRLYALAFVCVSCIAGGYAYYLATTTDTRDIASYIVAPIEYQGVTYPDLETAIEAARALGDERTLAGLAYYAIANRITPIMGLTGTDPEALRTNMSLLAASAGALSASYRGVEAETIADALYPRQYLDMLPTLERARQELIASPSIERAAQYHKTLIETIDAYERGLVQIAHTIEIASAGHEDATFVYWGGESNPRHFIKELTALRRDSAALRQEAHDRWGCVQQFDPKRCAVDTLRLPLARAPEIHLSEELHARVAEHAALLRRRVADPIEGDADAGYLIALNTSTCFPEETPVVYYPWEATPAHRPAVYRYEVVNDLFFYDLDELRGLPVYEALRAEGLSFMHQPANMPYLCPDSGYVMAALHTLRFIRAELSQHPLPAPAPSAIRAEEIESLAALAETVRTAPILTEQMVTAYFAAWDELVDAYGERALAESFGVAAVRAQSDLRTAFVQKTPYFERSIAFIEYLNVWMAALAHEHPTNYMALVLSRTLPSIIFMPGAGTITSSPRSFLATHHARDPHAREPRTRRYAGDLKEAVGADALVAQMHMEIDIMEGRFNLPY